MDKAEIFVDIKNYEGLYKVSTYGRVLGLKRNRCLTPKVSRDGYLFVCLSKGATRTNFYIHRLVAQAFIPNPMFLPQVNHKDENKQNCNVSNLEWCTVRYNKMYSVGKKVIQLLDGKEVATFASSQEVTRLTGIRHVREVCLGYAKTAGGFIWRYENEADI